MKIKVKAHKRSDGTKVKGHVRHVKGKHTHKNRSTASRKLLGNHKGRRKIRKAMDRLIGR